MKRRLGTRGGLLLPLLFGVLLIAGCGGNAEVIVVEPAPPTVGGQVLLPSGSVAQNATLLQRFASYVIATAEAVIGTVPAPNVVVSSSAVTDQDARENTNTTGAVIATALTDSEGLYAVEIGDLSVDGCTPALQRILVFVDAGPTRALAYGDENINIDANSEATVRLIFQRIADDEGASLCGLSNEAIQNILDSVTSAAANINVANLSPAAANDAVTDVAAANANVQEALNAAFGEAGTPTPTATLTSTATPTTTSAVSQTPTATQPSATPTNTATQTSTPEATFTPTTAEPTLTPTEVITPTVTPTGETSPTETPTGMPPATDTPTEIIPVATDTPTEIIPVATDTPTEVPATSTPTSTPTNPLPTNTFTATQTPTVEPTTRIDLSMGSGAPGAMVAITATLVGNPDTIVSTSNDITFDPTQVDLPALSNCVIDPRLQAAGVEKQISVGNRPNPPPGMRQIRVGIFGLNQNIIPDGVLFTCTFTIAGNATPGDKILDNAPTASNAAAQNVPVAGSDGVITVSSGAPTDTPTQAATSTPTNTATVPVPTNTATVPPAATDTPTQQPPTNTPTQPAPTLTPTTGAQAAINLSMGSGAPGAMVAITATLVGSPGTIVSTSNDITFDPTQVDLPALNNCVIDPRLQAAGIEKQISVGNRPNPPAGMRQIRVGIFGLNQNVIPDGVLFTCTFTIGGGATPGDKVLDNAPTASNASAQSVPVGGSDGVITVTAAAPTDTPTVVPPTTTPTQPAPTTTPTEGVSGPAINLSMGGGAPGAMVAITATLVGSPGTIVSTSNDITFANAVVDLPALNNCVIDPRLQAAGIEKQISVGNRPNPPAGMRQIRVGIFGLNQNVIPDGVLFTCTFTINAAAPTGDQTLINAPTASNAAAMSVPVTGTNGTISIAP